MSNNPITSSSITDSAQKVKILRLCFHKMLADIDEKSSAKEFLTALRRRSEAKRESSKSGGDSPPDKLKEVDNESERITPNQVVFVLRAIDPVAASSVSLEETKAVIAAELLMDEADFGKTTMFEAVQSFDTQANLRVIAFADFLIMFENKGVASNAVEMLNGALLLSKETQKKMKQFELEETQQRKATQQQEQERILTLGSQLRRAKYISDLKGKLEIGYQRNKRELEIDALGHVTQQEEKQLEELRHDAQIKRDLQEQDLGTMIEVEEHCQQTEENVLAQREQVRLLQQWANTATALTMSEAQTAWKDICGSLEQRYAAVNDQLGHLESKVLNVGRCLFINSIACQGRRPHLLALKEVYEQVADNNHQKIISSNFSWLVPSLEEKCLLLANQDFEADELKAIELLDDVQNVSYNPEDTAVLKDLTLAKIEDCFHYFTANRLDLVNLHPHRKQQQEIREVAAMNYAQFLNFLKICKLALPGSAVIAFMDSADVKNQWNQEMQAALFDEAEEKKGRLEVGEKHNISTALLSVALSFDAFAHVLTDIALFTYSHLVRYASQRGLVEKLLRDHVAPKMHFLTIRDAIQLSTSPSLPPKNSSGMISSFQSENEKGADLVSLLKENAEIIGPYVLPLAECYVMMAQTFQPRTHLCRGINALSILRALLSTDDGNTTSAQQQMGCPIMLKNANFTHQLVRQIQSQKEYEKLRVLFFSSSSSSTVSSSIQSGLPSVVSMHTTDTALDTLAGWLHIATPIYSPAMYMHFLIQSITAIMLSTFDLQQQRPYHPALVLEMLWSVLPGEDEALIHESPVPFLLFLAAVCFMNRLHQEEMPSLKTTLENLRRKA